MAMNLERVKSNIRAMLNLANDSAAAQGEIDNALRFVKKLMEEHQLSEDDIGDDNTIDIEDKLINLERAEMGTSEMYFNGGKLSDWETSAASFVCELVGGVKYYWTGRQPYLVDGVRQFKKRNGRLIQRRKIVFYGIAEDTNIAQQVYAELTTTIAAMAKIKWGGVFRGAGRSYCEGFVSGLWRKHYEDKNRQLKLANQGSSSDGKSRALVLVEGRNELIAKKEQLAIKYRQEGLGITKMKTHKGFKDWKRTQNEDAKAEGREDGKSHNVSATRHKKLSGPSN